MAEDPFADASTAVDEPGWGGGVVGPTGDGMHITDPVERRKYKQRSRRRKQRWGRAMAIRATLGPEDFEQEEARLRAEIDAWEEGHRDAA
jgi:hypothetical protein